MSHKPSLVEQVQRDRALEAEFTELERRANELRARLSPPRAGRMRALRLAEAYRLVMDDTRSVGGRGRALFGAGSEQAKRFESFREFLAHRLDFLK